jgi:hypothetical protein
MKNKAPTIAQLRRTGWKVAVIHNFDWNCRKRTHIVVTNPEGQHAEGIAVQHVSDNYNRKIGNAIALGRALKNMDKGNFCEFQLLFEPTVADPGQKAADAFLLKQVDHS